MVDGWQVHEYVRVCDALFSFLGMAAYKLKNSSIYPYSLAKTSKDKHSR